MRARPGAERRLLFSTGRPYASPVCLCRSLFQSPAVTVDQHLQAPALPLPHLPCCAPLAAMTAAIDPKYNEGILANIPMGESAWCWLQHKKTAPQLPVDTAAMLSCWPVSPRPMHANCDRRQRQAAEASLPCCVHALAGEAGRQRLRGTLHGWRPSAAGRMGTPEEVAGAVRFLALDPAAKCES